MQLIVTCAGCGAKYRGESSPKKFRCAACSNLFTFPEKPMAASTGTILCSNCWTETVPTEKLKACGFCSQRVSPRYGGQSSEDKQIKVKQPNVRTDLNLVKAASLKSSADIPNNTATASSTSSETGGDGGGSVKFSSNEWKELNSAGRQDLLPDSKRTQAFELLAELKKELEPEMAGVVESMQKSQDDAAAPQKPSGEHALRSSGGVTPLPQTATGSTASSASSAAISQAHAPAESEVAARFNALEIQLDAERGAQRQLRSENDSMQSRIAELEERLRQEKSLREAGTQEDAVRELQAKVAELSSLVQADKRSREQLLRERADMEELWRGRDAKVAELNARLLSDSSTRAALAIERDQLAHFKQEHEARSAEMDARLNSERTARESLLREHTELAEAHRESSAKLAEMSTRLNSDKGVRDTATRKRDEMDDTLQEMSARIADLETRLSSEKRSKDALIRERDQLSDGHRELQARVADVETRWHSEREAKEALVKKRDELLETHSELDARVADLDSRLTSERQAKESASAERDNLHELRKELDAKAADLSRRHANERDAKERALKDHGQLSVAHRELSAKFADTSTRLKSEQDGKDAVRKERDEALVRADSAESRIEKSEAEVARLRKGLTAHAERMTTEFKNLMGAHSARVAELASHARLTRKRLEEEALNQASKIESVAVEINARMSQDSTELAQRLNKIMQEHQESVQTGQSGRQAAQTGAASTEAASAQPLNAARISGSHAPQPSENAPASSGSARMNSAAQPAAQGSAAIESGSSGPNKVLPPDQPPGSGSSSRNAVIDNPDVAQDKSSGTFWAKVFKRPATKTQ